MLVNYICAFLDIQKKILTVALQNYLNIRFNIAYQGFKKVITKFFLSNIS